MKEILFQGVMTPPTQVHRARLLTLLETMLECVIVIASEATFLPETLSQFDALWTLTKTNRRLGALLMPCVSLTTVGGASRPLIRGSSPSAMTLSLCDRYHSLHHQAELHTDEVKRWSLSLSDCMRRTRVLRSRDGPGCCASPTRTPRNPYRARRIFTRED